MSKKMNKVTQNKLKHRNIDISKHKPKMISVTKNTYLDVFSKSDLEDEGTYEVELDEDYGDYFARLTHTIERLETEEELANRLCKEYDDKKRDNDLKERRKQKTIQDAKKLGMEFK